MQPLLLLKQTLEASYDPGPLRIDGPNVEFTSAEQFFSRLGPRKARMATELVIGVEAGNEQVQLIFKRGTRGRPLDLVVMQGRADDVEYALRSGMDTEEVQGQLTNRMREFYGLFARTDQQELVLEVVRNRCFFDVGVRTADGQRPLVPGLSYTDSIGRVIRGVIHIPGLRGNPERLYPVTAVGQVFPGQFQTYVASIISQASERVVHDLGEDLRRLGLTWKIRASPVSDTQVEIRVGRLAQAQQGGAQDLVSIADVGLGVSQIVPILVALRIAQRGQTVFLEQPEIHLHPRALVEMARLMGEAVGRGVRLVLETHSDLIALALQTLVAEGELEPDLVKLHWFTRNLDGVTHVASADVDEAGAFGDWPEDFADVQLSAKDRYLTAAEPKMRLFDEGD